MPFDWDRVVATVLDVARKAFALAGALVLVMGSAAMVFIAGIALWWLVNRAQAAVGW